VAKIGYDERGTRLPFWLGKDTRDQSVFPKASLQIFFSADFKCYQMPAVG